MQSNENYPLDSGTPPVRWRHSGAPWILAVGIVVGVAGVGYGVHHQSQAARTAESQRVQQAALQTEMSRMQQQMQQQIQRLQDRLVAQDIKEQEAAAALPPTPPSPSPAVRPASSRRVSARPPARPVEDPRIKQLEQKFSEQNEKLADQSQKLADQNQKLADQGEKLADTRRLVDTTRSDLEGRISSTSQELHGSIARTSEEVAALRRRGERDYFEFDLARSKALSRIGPLSVALRKADLKRKRFNLDLLVDDNKVEKKNVNILEPVYLTGPEWTQPVELVVNRIEKDRIRGYVSTPKYKRSDLLASSGEQHDKAASKFGPVQP